MTNACHSYGVICGSYEQCLQVFFSGNRALWCTITQIDQSFIADHVEFKLSAKVDVALDLIVADTFSWLQEKKLTGMLRLLQLRSQLI